MIRTNKITETGLEEECRLILDTVLPLLFSSNILFDIFCLEKIAVRKENIFHGLEKLFYPGTFMLRMRSKMAMKRKSAGCREPEKKIRATSLLEFGFVRQKNKSNVYNVANVGGAIYPPSPPNRCQATPLVPCCTSPLLFVLFVMLLHLLLTLKRI